MPTAKEAKPVEVQKPFMELVKEDASQAAYRVAAAKMTKLVKQGIIETMKKEKKKKSQISAIQDLLDSEMGESLISFILGVALEHFPMLKEDPRAQRMAKEFRTASLATAGNVLMDKVMEQLVPALKVTWENLPMIQEAAQTEVMESKASVAPVATA